MKRRFLLWLDSFHHKPKFLKRAIEMSYWSDILDLHERKQKTKTELDKKLENIEEKLSQYVNGLRKSLLATDGDGGVIMTQLPRTEAAKQMVETLRRNKYKDADIFNYLKVLGFDNEWLERNLKTDNSDKVWKDMGTGKVLTTVKDPTPVTTPTTPTKPKTPRRTKNARRQTAKTNA